jgi:outer membrane protein assembly factor BamB
VTPDQDVIVSATFHGTIHPGTTMLVSEGADGFVARLDGAHGLLHWARQIGGAGDDGVYAMGIDASGMIYAGGFHEGGDAGKPDVLVTAIDADGNTVWQRTFGAEQRQLAYSLAVGPQGQLALAGDFYGTLELGENPALHCEVSPGVACDPFEHYPNAFGAVFAP